MPAHCDNNVHPAALQLSRADRVNNPSPAGFRSDIGRDVRRCPTLSGSVRLLAVASIVVADYAGITVPVVTPSKYRLEIFTKPALGANDCEISCRRK